MTGLTYSTYQQQLAIMAGYTVGADGVTITYDANFLAILPSAINYAENRLQRDLDFLTTQTSNSAIPFVAGSKTLSIPLTTFITLQTIEVIDLSGNSWPLLPVSHEFIQNVYGSGSTQGLPTVFNMRGSDTAGTAPSGTVPANLTVLVGPTPDQAYTTRLYGTIRFAPLSSTNASTFISTYLPELFLMASLIYISAFQRNFGKMSDDPAQAMTYEQQYKELLEGAMGEENRKKMMASAWTAYSTPPAATPSRG